MENRENTIYKELLEKLKVLISKNSSVKEIQTFLTDIDSAVASMSVSVFDDDFLIPFYSLLETRTEKSTIGDELFNSCLESKIKLPPSLLMYFYLKQKDILGFKHTYNRFKIGTSDIAYTAHEEDKHLYYNFNYHWKKYNEPDVFNYQCMEHIMHELVHIYQFSIPSNTEDMYEKLICNDREIFLLSIDAGILGYGGLHDDYLIEHHANVCSRHFMTNFAKNNSNYFDSDFIKSKQEDFLKTANRNSYYGGQRVAFKRLLEMAFELIPDLMQSDKSENGDRVENSEELYNINKKKMEELLKKDILLRSYIDANPNMQDPLQQIYLGLGLRDLKVLEESYFSPRKGNTK